jgi:ssDNA-binding Zn-finger/Zn-ribbon topoisomerase 1
MEDQGGMKIVRCEPCDSVMKLPRKGVFMFFEKICPLCSFQVIQVTTEANTKYHLCPMCYSHPPDALFEDANEMTNQMPCFKCPSMECSLAQGANNRPIMGCGKCKSKEMMIRKNKNGKYFLACSDNTTCKLIINVPSSIKEAFVTNQSCTKCNSKRVKLKFNEGEVLDQLIAMRIHEDDSMFCFGPNCDAELASLGYENYFVGNPMPSTNPRPQINISYQNNSSNRPSNQSNQGSNQANNSRVFVPANQITPPTNTSTNQISNNPSNVNRNPINNNPPNNNRIVSEPQPTQKVEIPKQTQTNSVQSILQRYTNLSQVNHNPRPGLASDTMAGRVQANQFRTEIVEESPGKFCKLDVYF